MISILASFGTSDGQVFKTLAEAQAHEIFLTFGTIKESDKPLVQVLCAELVQNAEKILDILSTKPNSRPKARKINGGTKKRKITLPPLPPDTAGGGKE